MRKVYALFLLLFISHPSLAYDGNDLYKWATDYSKDNVANGNAIFYEGYVSASASFAIAFQTICIPAKTRDGQFFDIVYDYLKSNPSKRTDNAVVLITQALKEAYPCGKK